MSDLDQLMESLTAQAIGAMNAGADPLKVNAQLRSMLLSKGITNVKAPVISDGADDNTTQSVEDFWNNPLPDKETKANYRNAVVPQVIQDLKTASDSPDPLLAGGILSGSQSVNPKSDWENFKNAANSAAGHGISGLLDIGGSIANTVYPQSGVGDDAIAKASEMESRFNAQDKLNASNTKSPLSSMTGGLLGGAVAGLGVGYVGNIPRRDLEENMTPLQAWADTTTEGAKLAGQYAVPGFGPTLGWAGRTALGSAATPAIGAAGDLLHNAFSDEDHQTDVLDPTARGLEAACGAIGSAGAKYHEGSIEAKIRAAEAARKAAQDKFEATLPRTGDSAFDVGASIFKDIHAANDPDLSAKLPDYGEKGQPDLILPPQVEDTASIGNLFTTTDSDAAAVEAARQENAYAQNANLFKGLANKGVKVDDTPLNIPAPEDVPSMRSPYDQNIVENLAERQGQIPTFRGQPLPDAPSQFDMFGKPIEPDAPIQPQLTDANGRTLAELPGRPVGASFPEEVPTAPAQAEATVEATGSAPRPQKPTAPENVTFSNDVEGELPVSNEADQLTAKLSNLQDMRSAELDKGANANKARLVALSDAINVTKSQIASARAKGHFSFENNASGESSASLEAIHRQQDEKAAGQTRLLIDRDGSVIPLIGPDAVDATAKAGQIIVQRGIGKNEWTPISSDPNISPDLIAGKINRARNALSKAHEEASVPQGHADILNKTDSNGNSLFARVHNVAASVLDALDKNELTGEHVLNSVISNHAGKYTPEVVALAKDAKRLADMFGGLDSKIEVYDPSNPLHQEIAKRNAKSGEYKFEDSAALYDPHTNTILLNKGVTARTLVHETLHAITSSVLDMGEAGHLTGAARRAFYDFRNVFEVVKEHALEVAEKNKQDRIASGMSPEMAQSHFVTETYGLTNLHELVAEMYGNGRFRDFLKSIELKNIKTNPKSLHGAILNKATTAYNTIVKGLSRILGLSPKAENAYELMMSHHQDLMSKAEHLSGDIRRNTTDSLRNRGELPDTSFLGEMAPSRYSVSNDEPKFTRPRGKVEAKIRDMLLAKGNRPDVTRAAESVRNEKNANSYQATTLNNKYAAEQGKVNPEALSNAIEHLDPEALEAVKKQSPSLGARIETELAKKQERSQKLADLMEADPNKTPEDQKHIEIIRDNKDYLRTSYGINTVPDYANRFMANVKRGQTASVNILNNAKSYLAKRWLPTVDELAATGTDKLKQLYKMHIGKDADADLSNVSLSAEDSPSNAADANRIIARKKAAIMRHRIADAIENIPDKGLWADTAVKDILGLNGENTFLGSHYAGLSHSSGVYSKLKTLPPPVSDLRGRVNDPVHRLSLTIEEQGRQIAELQAQHNLRSTGLQNGMFSTKLAPTHTVKIEGAKMGPLRNLYTTPDIAKALEGVEQTHSFADDIYNGIGRLTALNKANTIVGNPGNIAVNAIGAPIQMLANGNINPKYAVRGLRASLKLIGSGLRKSADDDVDFLIRNGFTEFSQTSELQAHSHGPAIASMLEQAAKQPNPVRWMLQHGGEALRLYNDVYGNADLWSKFANVFREKDFWQKQHPEWTEQQLASFIKKRIDNTNITPSNVSPVFRVADKSGIGFVTKYFANVFKNLGYNAVYGLQDTFNGIRSGNAALFQHGLLRVGGVGSATLAANSLYGALAKTGASALGLNANTPDETRQSYLNKDDVTASRSNLILSDPNKSEAGEFTLDIDRPNPYGPGTQPVNRLLEAWQAYRAGDMQKAEEAMRIAGNDVVGLVSNNTVYKKLSNIIQGKQPSIAYNAPTSYQDAQDIGFNKLGLTKENVDKLLNLTSIAIPSGITKALVSREVPSGTPLKPLAGAGIGITPFNVGKDIQNYLGQGLNSDITKARKPYMDLMKSDIPIDEDRMDEQFRSHMKDLVKPYDKMVAAVDAAKAQGLSRREIGIKMINSKMNQDVIGMVLNNKPVPILMMLGDPEQTLIDNINKEDDPEKKEQLRQQAKEKMKIFSSLIQKYRGVTLDELRNE